MNGLNGLIGHRLHPNKSNNNNILYHIKQDKTSVKCFIHYLIYSSVLCMWTDGDKDIRESERKSFYWSRTYELFGCLLFRNFEFHWKFSLSRTRQKMNEHRQNKRGKSHNNYNKICDQTKTQNQSGEKTLALLLVSLIYEIEPNNKKMEGRFTDTSQINCKLCGK